MNFFSEKHSGNQFIKKEKGISLYLKREDLLQPEISGNKFRKLKYNLIEAENLEKTTILTFGGAFSNHISAVAAAGKIYNFQTIGIIRGKELGNDPDKTLSKNSTLKFARSCGMHLEFVSREEYRNKTSDKFIQHLKNRFGDFYLLPEGGTNSLAIKGCEEILSEEDKEFDFICCPVGTGGTVAGIINSSEETQKILGFSALKGDFLTSEVKKITRKKNWEIIIDYHFNGYAKVTEELIEFINWFKKEYNIQLDPVYTGKMMFGIFDLIEKNAFSQNSRILAIHTGGLQGIYGMNQYLKKKKLPQIIV